jgi:hypothetical protein
MAIGYTPGVLFGSEARGEAGPDSDIDVLVVQKVRIRPSAPGQRPSVGDYRCEE